MKNGDGSIFSAAAKNTAAKNRTVPIFSLFLPFPIAFMPSRRGLGDVRKLKRGVSVIEYVIGVAFVLAALLSMRFYVKHAVEGRMRQASAGTQEIYYPRRTIRDETLTFKGTSTDVFTSEDDPDDPDLRVTQIDSKGTTTEQEHGFRDVYVPTKMKLFN